MRIALDVEGVLADSHAAARERSDRLDASNCPPPDWSFGDEDLLDHYLHVTQNLWHNHYDEIDPMPQPDGWDLGWVTKRLSAVHDVDVVTNRTGVDDQIREWLRDNRIHYDEFKSIIGNKVGAGDYDVHVDDSPNVVADVLSDGRKAFLIDRSYNQHVSLSENLERVESVYSASQKLR